MPPKTYLSLSAGSLHRAPFESSFSVFLKLIVVNVISKKNLFDYINKDGATFFNPGFWTGSWIDFPLLSKSTGISVSELKSCFIDQIVPIVGTTRPVIKHCPMCLEKGYHSVFFYLRGLKYCPWHKKELEYCKYCSQIFDRDVVIAERKMSVMQPFKLSLICGHFVFDSDLGVDFNVNDQDFRDILYDHGMRFVGWVKRARAENELAASFIGILDDQSGHGLSALSNLVNLCEKGAGKYPWLKPARPTANKSVSYDRGRHKDIDGRSRLASLKSIRRHIFKTYLGDHRKCFNALTHLTTHESLWLEAKCTCPVALAAIAWMLLFNQMAIKTNKMASLRPIFIAPKFSGHTRDIVESYLYHFLGVWSAIENALDRSTASGVNCMVELSPPHWKDYIKFSNHCAVISPHGECSGGEVTIMYPDAAALSVKCFKRCFGVLSEDKAISEHVPRTIEYWRYGHEQQYIFRFLYIPSRLKDANDEYVYIG